MNQFININEPITDALVDTILENMIASVAEDDTLILTIHSAGGQLDAAKRFASVVSSFPRSIAFTDYCMSAATVIFLSANTRIVSSDVQFMIHNPSLAVEGDRELHLLAADVLEVAETELVEFYSQFTEPENFLPYMVSEELIPTEELVKINFATTIEE